MRLCSYVVNKDTGFAPNPLWGYCTCAACTPNHMSARIQPTDWLLGNSSADHGAERTIIYAMRISEVLNFDEYYRDPRFTQKKARHGNWQDRCGDNIYFRNEAGEWEQALAFFHTTAGAHAKDLRYPRVFISDHFFYFGEKAPVMPPKFAELLKIGQGIEWHEGAIVRKFIEWLERSHRPGMNGEPRDRYMKIHDSCAMRCTDEMEHSAKSVIQYTAGYKYDPDGVHARVLDFPGAISCGTDLDDARMMLADALWAMAESYILDGDSVPQPQPSTVDSEMDIIEPIYLNLSASSQPLPQLASVAHEED